MDILNKINKQQKSILNNIKNAPKSKQKGRNRRRPKKGKNSQRKRAVKRVDSHTLQFLRTYVDPWKNTGAKLPFGFLQPVDLLHLKVTGTGATNASGYGWVLFSTAHAVSNEFICAYASNAGTAPDTPSFNGTGAATFFSNSPYTGGDFLATDKFSFAFRPVSCGVSLRSTTTTLNTGGTAYMVQGTPRSNNLDGITVAQLTTYPCHKRVSFRTNKELQLVRHITSYDDLRFQQFADGAFVYEGNTGHPSQDGFYNMVILIHTEPNIPFEIEYAANYELIGSRLQRPSISKHSNLVPHIVSSKAQKRMGGPTTVDDGKGKSSTAIISELENIGNTVLSTLKEGGDLIEEL